MYNYRELREELRSRGYEFESDTDTEVVLHAYDAFGQDCVERFRGMFAFAIWDPEAEQVFAARDRFGIKPFYYTSSDGLAFASKVTALLESNVAAPQLDLNGVDGFLTFGSVPAPRTIVEGVRSLPPGSVLHYEPGSAPQVDSYFTPLFAGDRTSPSGLRQLLTESIRLRLRSDVPVGAFLSGGLDSSTIVALADQIAPDGDLRTFSIEFESDQYSETEYALRVSDYLGTDHTSYTVTPGDVREALPDIVSAMDQPTVDGVNTYFVSKVAADAGLKVALSGLGSDELFYGYPSFRQVPRLAHLSRLTSPLPEIVRSAAARVIDRAGSRTPLLPLADLFESDYPFGAGYVATRGLFGSRERQRLHGTEPVDWSRFVSEAVDSTLRAAGDGDAVSHAELSWYMQNQLLRDTDVMSMSHSLEVRTPFLDAPLASAVMETDQSSKSRGEKLLLKEAVEDLLPSQILERKKTGFTFPFAEWVRNELSDVVADALDPAALESTPLTPGPTERVQRSVMTGERHWSRAWALAVLSMWVDEHLK
jgi:asparagine synthase (glutamine-hydrolysing)